VKKQAHRALPAWRAFLSSFLAFLSLRNLWVLSSKCLQMRGFAFFVCLSVGVTAKHNAHKNECLCMAQQPACSFGELSSDSCSNACLKHCCTATCTATPTNFNHKTQHTMNRIEPFQAQEGQGRTPANWVCRVPPSACRVFSSHPTIPQARLQAT